MIVKLIEQVYSFLWGDLLQIPLPGGGSVGISLLIILLIPAGIYFTIIDNFFRILGVNCMYTVRIADIWRELQITNQIIQDKAVFS